MKARLKNYRQAPRKVRLVADLIRGKNASQALTVLSFLPKKAAGPMKKLLSSAVSNSEAQGAKREDLIVSSITVDKGVTFKRWAARARGRATPIRKETSHVALQLNTIVPVKNK